MKVNYNGFEVEGEPAEIAVLINGTKPKKEEPCVVNLINEAPQSVTVVRGKYKKRTRKFTRWKKSEESKVIAMVREGKSFSHIGKELGRGLGKGLGRRRKK